MKNHIKQTLEITRRHLLTQQIMPCIKLCFILYLSDVLVHVVKWDCISKNLLKGRTPKVSFNT